MREHLSRLLGPIGSVAVMALVVLACAIPAPRTPGVALVTANENICGARYFCPADPAPDGPDQTTAEQRIIDGYVTKQVGCTPDLPPNPQSVTWDPPGFTPNVGGSGNINDANPQLGGHFTADYVNGHWHVAYLYC